MNQSRLFYDAQCPLCSREIEALRRRLQRPLELVNIHDMEPEDGVPDSETLMRILHYQSAEGRWQLGLDATVSAWRHTRYGVLFGWLRWPLVRFRRIVCTGAGRRSATAAIMPAGWATRRYWSAVLPVLCLHRQPV